MPTLNVRDEKWDRWFQELPTWPAFLTKNFWDKNKSLIAKMTLATGVGDQLKACEAAFKAASPKMPFFSGARQVDVDKSIKDCQAYVSDSAVKTLHAELKALRDIAKKAAAECQKNKLIPKATTQLCTDIANAADTLMVCCNPNSLAGCLAQAVKTNEKAKLEKQQKMAGPVVQLSKNVPAKVLGLIPKMRQVLGAVPLDKAQAAIGGQLSTCARDMTQPIGNLIKCVNAGVTFANFDLAEAQRLSKVLVPYGDGDAAKCAGCSKEQIEAKLAVVEQAANDMKKLVSNLQLQG